MELEDLVTGALAPKEQQQESSSPAQIILENQRIQPGGLAELIERAIPELQQNPERSWDLVSEIVAYQIASSLSSSLPRNTLLLFHAESATRGDSGAINWIVDCLQEIRESMLETEQKRRRSSAIGSFSSSLDFLVSVWGDQAEEEIAFLTGAKRPTVRKWLAGSSAQWKNSNKVMSVARVLFVLIEEQSRSEANALQWFRSPLSSGKSPRELWSQGHWSIPAELRSELEQMGINER